MTMAHKKIVITPSAVSTTIIAAAQQPSGATPLTLSTTSLEEARILLVTDAGDNTGKSLVFLGKDADNNIITETVAGTSTSTAVTTKAYKTITSITASGAYSHNVSVGDVGTTLSEISQTIPLDYYLPVAVTVGLEISGTANVTIQETTDDVLREGTANTVWTDTANLAGKSASTIAQVSRGASAIRAKINSYSTGAVITLQIIHAHQSL